MCRAQQTFEECSGQAGVAQRRLLLKAHPLIFSGSQAVCLTQTLHACRADQVAQHRAAGGRLQTGAGAEDAADLLRGLPPKDSGDRQPLQAPNRRTTAITCMASYVNELLPQQL